jgi:hypothetical protein
MKVIDPDSFSPDEVGGMRGSVTATLGTQSRRVVAYKTTLNERPALVALSIVIAKRRLRRRSGFVTLWLDHNQEIAGFRPGEGGGRAVSFGPPLRSAVPV